MDGYHVACPPAKLSAAPPATDSSNATRQRAARGDRELRLSDWSASTIMGTVRLL